ncbi:hypothetical protein GV828_01570 [Flavobacterium sp. NST-5]|uniref:DUF3575 domain-containing protein n=1 Tax=Flavobacterium ichthyis TaxID=2698827 RepID=A0ABW9ZAP9_9FLAO|nr:hypothetical protein [Flavobacterium ichthyis]NBL63883.1 hypothetical protein [Flavobacterium ichthyis]
MKKIIFFLLTSVSVFAQTDDSRLTENFAKINLGLHGLDASYEWALNDRFVWENSVGFGMGMAVDGNAVEYTFNFNDPALYAKSEMKYFYNLGKRQNKGKNISNNGGNYVGIQTKYSFGTDAFRLNNALLSEVHWGIQRSLGGNFSFNTHIGLGYVRDYDLKDGAFSPTFKLTFSYAIF